MNTAVFLSRRCSDLDVRVGELPQNGLKKVDLNDYLSELGDGDLSPVLRSAKPAHQHTAFDAAATREAHRSNDSEPPSIQIDDGVSFDAPDSSGERLWSLTFVDVANVSAGYRGTNPLGHHSGGGGSTDYFEVRRPTYAVDYKYGVSYNPTAFLLCRAGEREPRNPHGRLSDEEVFVAWAFALEELGGGVSDQAAASNP